MGRPVRARLSTTTLVSLLAVLAILATLLTACGGGGEGPTPSVTPTTPTPQALPSGTAVVADNRFEYPARGYSVEIPDGWSADADYLSGPTLSTDAFFAPAPEAGGPQANISVTIESLQPDVTTESYVDLKMTTIRGLAKDEPRLTQREVGGVEATVVEYAPSTKDINVEKTDVIFVRGARGWTITLSVPAGQRADFQTVFDSFLASYQPLGE